MSSTGGCSIAAVTMRRLCGTSYASDYAMFNSAFALGAGSTQNLETAAACTIKAVDCAVADKTGELTLFLDPLNRGEASLKIVNSSQTDAIRVPAVTLLELLGLAHVERDPLARELEIGERGGDLLAPDELGDEVELLRRDAKVAGDRDGFVLRQRTGC